MIQRMVPPPIIQVQVAGGITRAWEDLQRLEAGREDKLAPLRAAARLAQAQAQAAAAELAQAEAALDTRASQLRQQLARAARPRIEPLRAALNRLHFELKSNPRVNEDTGGQVREVAAALQSLDALAESVEPALLPDRLQDIADKFGLE